jgi:Family of unknown function (DUF6173)
MSDTPNFPNGLRELSQIMPPSLAARIPQIPNLEIRNPIVEAMESNYASEFHKRLMKWIGDFDQSLDDQHEVGVRLVSFGSTVVFHLGSIGYWNPSLLVFSGNTEGGEPVELIQHVSQISILLMKLPLRDPKQPKRPVGFCAESS